MSSTLCVRYTGPIPFDTFTAETRQILSALLDHVAVPELVEFSAPELPSTRPRRQYLGPECDWLLLGWRGSPWLFELGLYEGFDGPEFAVEFKGWVVAWAAAVSAAAALARLNGAVVKDTAHRCTSHFELPPDRFLEEVRRTAPPGDLEAAAEFVRSLSAEPPGP